MKAPVFDMQGKEEKQIDLPSVFSEAVRPDLINRAAMAVRSTRFQPKGTYILAGIQTSADYVGRRRAYRTMMNISRARLPRVKLPKGRFGDVVRVPQARGGRVAHPPVTDKTIVEKINKKERRKAIRSAIAATAHIDLVKKRGHKIDAGVPIILDDSFEKLSKTKDILALFEKLFSKELERTKEIKIRAGRGKMRGRKYKKKKGPLVVFTKECPAMKAAHNITGVDISLAKNLNADMLAPGGQPGRLAVFTESAVKELDKLFR